MKFSNESFVNRYFLPINETCELIGLSRSTVKRMEKRGDFPPSVQLSPMRKGYRTSDLKVWMESK